VKIHLVGDMSDSVTGISANMYGNHKNLNPSHVQVADDVLRHALEKSAKMNCLKN